MAKKPIPTPEELRQLLRYDPETGKLYWLERDKKWYPPTATGERLRNAFNFQFAGKEALATSRGNSKHKRGEIFRKPFYAHRVAWAIYYGSWPKEEIDHIDGDPTNNSIGNLRAVSRSENMRNKSIPKNNTSGCSGVSFDRKTRKWVARAFNEGERFVIGYFEVYDEAVSARMKALNALGYHANHGRRRAQG